MAEPFIAEIKLFSFPFAPRGYAMCNGQLLPINQNQALFSLLGTTYGGNGQTNFSLPDARDRVLLGFSPQIPQGTVGGEGPHTLTNSEIPAHIHAALASSAIASLDNPANAFSAGLSVTGTKGELIYSVSGPDSSALVLANSGGSQPHDNHQPSTVLNYCIALQGIFPSRN